MWKWFHQFAKPERLYPLCGRLIPWFGGGAIICLAVGWVWGLGFAPSDYQQGDSFRIMYLHVPAAIWSMGIYMSMAIAAFVGLVWQIKMADNLVAAMAPVGAVLTFIALVTGSAWGKPMWGTWWIWDARLTSELVLLFLYLGVIALYTRLMIVNWLGELPVFWCWLAWLISLLFISPLFGGIPCIKARPICSKVLIRVCAHLCAGRFWVFFYALSH